MKRYSIILIAVLAVSAWSQTTDPVDRAQRKAENRADSNESKAEMKDQMRADMAALTDNVTRMTAQAAVAATMTNRMIEDMEYQSGTQALDHHRYDEAVRDFDKVIKAKSTRSDGALYWKAYALNRQGMKDDALAALEELQKNYPSSPWIKDSQALQAEVKQSSGQPISPADESNEDIKLLAINGLMNVDPGRAVPLIGDVLKSSNTPAVQDRALFVLTQSRAPAAQQLLLEYAKGSGNPDLRMRAIQYIGMSGSRDIPQQLSAIYSAAAEASVKNAVLHALMNAHANDALLTIAKSEKDGVLLGQIVSYLAMQKTVPPDQLFALYSAANDKESKLHMIDLLLIRGDAKTLVDMAHRETDPEIKKAIVTRLSTSPTMRYNKDATDYMAELLK